MAVRIEPGSEPIPGYKLIDRIGGGGFGEVWKAEAPGGLLKAIKVVYGDLTSADPDGTRRAEQELKALKRVQSVRHPYLLSLERFDIVENRLLIVMELADRNLWDRFREARTQSLIGVPRDELLRYMEETAEVLDLMNTQYQLQHLDIKPQNLFLVHNHAKVADFGLVKDLEGNLATVTGGITPVYAAPETFDGVVSRFCDQYSLAIVYQELLTGQRPFSGNSIQQLIMQHLSAVPNLSPLPREDRPIIARGLEKKPENRYPSCSEMIKALRNVVLGAPEPAPIPGRADPRVLANSGKRVLDKPVTEPAPYKPKPPVIPPAPSTVARTETPVLPPEPAEVILPVQELKPFRLAPPDAKGDGVLRPALVLALGQVGLSVLQALRDGVEDRFGSLEGLPTLRTLYIDTDPDAAQAASSPTAAWPLSPDEVLNPRLNRQNHYRQPGGRSVFESWLSHKVFSRIPARNPTTTGLRALGRLALMDHYKTIAGRLREELETLTDPELLAGADAATQLGVRTNRPRVYLIAGLGGGTGGGMVLDLAYLCRYLLRQFGYTDPDVIGVLLLPTAPQAANRTMALGNAVGALTELHHFSQPEHAFTYRPDDRDGRVRDPDPPFRQTILMPLEPEEQAARSGETARLVGDYLYRDLTSPLGKTADERRNTIRRPKEPAITCQTLNLFRISWPRRTLLRRTSRLLCFQLVELWTGRDGGALQGQVKARLGDELQQLGIDTEHLIEQLQEIVDGDLKRKPESYFREILAPLAPRGRSVPGLDDLLEALGEIEELVGTPEELSNREARRQGALIEYLDRAVLQVAREWGPRFVQVALGFIDVPELRLRGAEEAIEQLSVLLDGFLEENERIAHQWGEEAAHDYDEIVKLLRVVKDGPNSRRALAAIGDLVELFDRYARGCYRCLQLRQVASLYAQLRDHLTASLQQVEFCRQRLGELLQAYEDLGGKAAPADPVPGACLLPAGCNSPEDAVRRLSNSLTQTDRKRLDHLAQELLREKFGSLTEVCLKSANVVKDLEVPLQQVAESAVTGRLVATNIVDLFLGSHANETSAVFDIRQAFVSAAPELARPLGDSQDEVRVLALPPGARAGQLRSMVNKALPEAIAVTESPEDIVFYREQPFLPLEQLAILGAAGTEAYEQMSENFSPHSRSDITDWAQIRKEDD